MGQLSNKGKSLVVLLAVFAVAAAMGFQHAPKAVDVAMEAASDNGLLAVRELNRPALLAEGGLVVTTGRGLGESQLLVTDSRGNERWRSEPWQQESDLGPLAILNPPLLDASGNVYAADIDQVFSYFSDGRSKWAVSLQHIGLRGPLLATVIAGSEREKLGLLSVDGQMRFIELASGKPVGAVFSLIDAAGTMNDLPELSDWQQSLDSHAGRVLLQQKLAALPFTLAGVSTSANGRKLYVSGGRGAVDTLWAISANESAEILWSKSIPVDSGALAFSAESNRLYGFSGRLIYALLAENGEELWQTRLESVATAVSPGPHDRLYVASGRRLYSINGKSGTERWYRDYADFAVSKISQPENHTGDAPLSPFVQLDRVLSGTHGLLWTNIRIGRQLSLFGQDFEQDGQTWMLGLHPDDGRVVMEWAVPEEQQHYDGISASADRYLAIMARHSSRSQFALWQWMLPQDALPEVALRELKPSAGGLSGQIERGLALIAVSLAASDNRDIGRETLQRQLLEAEHTLESALKRGDISADELFVLNDARVQALAAAGSCVGEVCAGLLPTDGRWTRQMSVGSAK